MFKILIWYLIIFSYLLIGNFIHDRVISEIVKQEYWNKIYYNYLSVTSRIILQIIVIVFWLPMFISDILWALFKLIASNYEE